MGRKRKRHSTPKIACVICGVASTRVTVATLFDGEPMCWDCARRQHDKSGGKLPTPQTGTLVPTHEGRKRQ